MKTKLIILTFAFAVFAYAALAQTPYSLTIEIPAADVARLEEAFGSILGLGRPATQAEIETATSQWVGQSIQDYERRKNMATFTPPPFSTGSKLNAATPEPTPTPKKKSK